MEPEGRTWRTKSIGKLEKTSLPVATASFALPLPFFAPVLRFFGAVAVQVRSTQALRNPSRAN